VHVLYTRCVAGINQDLTLSYFYSCNRRNTA